MQCQSKLSKSDAERLTLEEATEKLSLNNALFNYPVLQAADILLFK